MKKVIYILFVFFICLSGCKDTDNGSDNGSDNIVYSLHDIGPGGGYIFYINPNSNTDGWTYLEAAPEDLTPSFSPVWSIEYNAAVGTTGTDIGTGKSNTNMIINQSIWSSAGLCDDFNEGGYSDWFLPSLGELELLYTELFENGLGDFNAYREYWSSSEYDAENAWCRDFLDGIDYSKDKALNYHIRPIRSF